MTVNFLETYRKSSVFRSKLTERRFVACIHLVFIKNPNFNFQGDRLWLDRNGSVEGQVDWTNPSSISPRKEFGAGVHPGRSTSIENWRKSKTDEEGGDWRNPTGPSREKWGENP